MAKRSVAKPGTQTVLTYNNKAKCEFRRLPFVRKNGPGAWDVPAAGGYQGGCEFGRWAAVAYLKMLRAEESAGPGYLQCIVLDMLKGSNGAEAGDSFSGQMVGFFSELDHALHSAAKADPRLDDYSEPDLAAAMTRAVNFDEDAWNAAHQKLLDIGGQENVPFVCFRAYRSTDKPTPANEVKERAA